MKKVLIIANLFHASPRIPGLAKYFPEFGWQPIILTTPLGDHPEARLGPSEDFRKNHRIIETYGYSSDKGAVMGARRRLSSRKRFTYVKPFLRLFYRGYSEIANYPDVDKGWKTFAVNVGLKLLQDEHIDAMISSSSPVTAHIIARELKEKRNIPWVADFRDLWTLNHNYPHSIFRKQFEKRLELRTLSAADVIVTAASIATEKMKTLHKGKRMFTVTNGFDPEKVNDKRISLTSKFTVTYTGQIYPEKQDSSKPLAALKRLISQGAIDSKDVEVRFFGPENETLVKNIKKLGLSDVVKCHGVIPREMALVKQRESQVLLLLNWEDPRIKEVYTGKIFEYLAAQRPILATGGFGKDVIEELLNETNSGAYCMTIEDTKNTLETFYQEYKSNGRVEYKGKPETINKFSYRELARKFAGILDSLV
jgi:glycosyltransferase involved in cell wall biosynthesis